MRKLMALLLAVTAAFSLTACKNNNGDGTFSNKDYTPNLLVSADAYDIEATLRVGVTSDPNETERLRKVIAAYNVVYPNVTVVPEVIPDVYNNNIELFWNKDTITPGTLPDMFLSNSEDMHAHIASGIFLDLQPYIDAELADDPTFLDAYYENMFVLGKERLDPDGDQYLIPRSADRIVTHINQRIFKQCFSSYKKEDLPFTPIESLYSLPEPQKQIVPENGWTWDEFLATCAALREYYDNNGMRDRYLIDSWITWAPVYYSLVKSAGAEFIDRATGEIKVESAEAIMNEILKELVEKRYIAPGGTTSQADYENGRGCMMFHSVYAQRWYEKLGDDYNVTTFPLYDKFGTPKIGTGVAGYVISSRTLEKAKDASGNPVYGRDLAWSFIRFMLTKEGQDALAESGVTTLPIRKDLADPADNVWGKALTEKGINMAAYAFGTEYCQPVDFYTGYSTDDYGEILNATTWLLSSVISGEDVGESIAECKETLEYFSPAVDRASCSSSIVGAPLGMAAFVGFTALLRKKRRH